MKKDMEYIKLLLLFKLYSCVNLYLDFNVLTSIINLLNDLQIFLAKLDKIIVKITSLR